MTDAEELAKLNTKARREILAREKGPKQAVSENAGRNRVQVEALVIGRPDVLFAELYKGVPVRLFIEHDREKRWLKYVHLKGRRKGKIGGMNDNMMSATICRPDSDITADDEIIKNALGAL